MPATSESALVYEMMRRLRAAGAYVEKNHGSAYSAGRPDLEGCYRGMFFGIEVKLPGNKPTTLQLYVLNEIQTAGGRAYVLDSIEQLQEAVNEWQRLQPKPKSSVSA